MSGLRLGDIQRLPDVIDMVQPPPLYEEKDLEELRESIQLIIADFVATNVREYMFADFEERVAEHTRGPLMLLYEHAFETFKDINIDDFISEGIYIYTSLVGIPRSRETSDVAPRRSKREIGQRIKALRTMPQPAQKTPEWFNFRWNRITASSAWRALDSQSSKNQLILSKCQPVDKRKYSRVNIGSATHHGQKYEDLSKTIYEVQYNTIVEEFGCIPDGKGAPIAASPDGINVRRENPRFGRLVEIKNPVSRKITGCPKKEYWVQMQIQMYVLELYECDFLETSFKEYASEEEFMADGDFSRTAGGDRKGVIACFSSRATPVYKYAPLDLRQAAFEEWLQNTIDNSPGLTWVQNSYWRLEKMSCVLVPYNAAWMDCVLPEFRALWDIVLEERKTGYEHRRPKKKKRKKANAESQELQQGNVVIKVRTESFEVN